MQQDRLHLAFRWPGYRFYVVTSLLQHLLHVPAPVVLLVVVCHKHQDWYKPDPLKIFQ